MDNVSNNKTASPKEIENFNTIAHEWWDKNGKFNILHNMNTIRMPWIFQHIESYISSKTGALKLIDVGCGGGLAAESCWKHGIKNIKAIDPSQIAIDIAKKHAEKQNININYQCAIPESIQQHEYETYDVCLALEIIEHTTDTSLFLKYCSLFLKPGGLLFISTLNKNIKSLLLAKISVEYILRWVPVGTHQWSQFIKPSEMNRLLNKNAFHIQEISGLHLNPLTREWKTTTNYDINYIVCAQKSYAETGDN